MKNLYLFLFFIIFNLKASNNLFENDSLLIIEIPNKSNDLFILNNDNSEQKTNATNLGWYYNIINKFKYFYNSKAFKYISLLMLGPTLIKIISSKKNSAKENKQNIEKIAKENNINKKDIYLGEFGKIITQANNLPGNEGKIYLTNEIANKYKSFVENPTEFLQKNSLQDVKTMQYIHSLDEANLVKYSTEIKIDHKNLFKDNNKSKKYIDELNKQQSENYTHKIENDDIPLKRKKLGQTDQKIYNHLLSENNNVKIQNENFFKLQDEINKRLEEIKTNAHKKIKNSEIEKESIMKNKY